MGVVYDELLIATMKEMNVCKKAIKKLSGTLNDMETKYNLTTAEFIERFENGRMRDEKDHIKWHDSYSGLKAWEQRLRELEEIIENAGKVCE